MKKTFYFHTLGCPKNIVDSQSMASLLMKNGYQPANEEKDAEFIVVNTCGFIQPAQEEALQILQEIAAEKRADQKLIAAGCLTQREARAVRDSVPTVDGLIGTRRWMDILPVIRKLEKQQPEVIVSIQDDPLTMEEAGISRAASLGGYAYLKIADGCDRRCAFCAIPLIKGPQVSRKSQAILQDVRRLQEQGVQELILIAQDVTSYGRDLGMQDGLPDLLEQIVKTAPDIPWIRLLYTYPGEVSDALIEVMAKHKQILPYLDIPLQHAHPAVLKRMKRPANMDVVRKMVARMRERIPDLAIRTTFIIGFPGESEEEFLELMEFVEEIQFDRLGLFSYFHEEGTSSFALSDDVPETLKAERIRRLAALQEEISEARNRGFIGKELDVIVDGTGDGISICRSYRDAPEIDGMVMVEKELTPGKITAVKITAAMVHDLIGKEIH